MVVLRTICSIVTPITGAVFHLKPSSTVVGAVVLELCGAWYSIRVPWLL